MPPNVVLIVTDNQSPWTLGGYGNEEILTPNADRLAREGVRFDNAFCINPVCSPNRATLLTGLMPSQHGVHNYLAGEEPDAQMGPHAYCTIEEFTTLPQILAEEGYRCGMSGKWHLGDSLHAQLGFSYWFAKPKGHTATFYDASAIWQEEVYTEPRYYPDAIAEHAEHFLRRAAGERFFLYVGFNGPYGLDRDMRTGHRNRHADYYADKPLACFPRREPHPWLRQNRDCIKNETAMRSYAAAVSGVDDGLGRILDALDAEGLEEETLVVFTADHGLCTGHHGWWGMSDHGRPLTMFEENLRVPLLWRHPAGIAPGVVCETAVSHYDFLPSLLDYAGMAERLPAEPELPGRSYAPALRGAELRWDAEAMFHEYENTRTIRTPRWKYTRRHPDGPDELFDLQNDPGEEENLAGSATHRDKERHLRRRLEAFFARYADPQYDLWRDGESKAGRILKG